MSAIRNVDTTYSAQRAFDGHSSIYRAVFDPDGHGLEPLSPRQLIIFAERRRLRAESTSTRSSSGLNAGGREYGSYGARVRTVIRVGKTQADNNRLYILLESLNQGRMSKHPSLSFELKKRVTSHRPPATVCPHQRAATAWRNNIGIRKEFYPT